MTRVKTSSVMTFWKTGVGSHKEYPKPMQSSDTLLKSQMKLKDVFHAWLTLNKNPLDD